MIFGLCSRMNGGITIFRLYETYTTLSQFFHQVLELEDYEKEALQLADNIRSCRRRTAGVDTSS